MTTPSVDDFDFIQLVIHDIHGFPKGRTLARRRMAGIVKHGLGIYGGICYFGIRDQVPLHEDFREGINFGNSNLRPQLNTLKPCPRLGQGKFKVGQVLCNMEHPDGTLDTSTPRTAAEIQIKRLQTELGLTIKSAFELEFTIQSESKKYFGHVNKFCNVSILEDCQGLLFDMVHELVERGVPVDSLQTEIGPGQFEVTLDIAEGVQGPDSTVDFKNIVKAFMKTKGYDATFMTRIDPALGACCSFHFNHSLWNSAGENVFLDTSKPNKLSELGCHWLAGLIEHAPAMMAFCHPTINCYRRVGAPFAPRDTSWSCEGRLSTFRLKLERGDNIYIENRLSTSASNPYLVLMCNIAAGIDGVTRKLPLPKQFDSSTPLPKDLESALKCLEEDTVLTKAMGSKLVEHFIFAKRAYEIKEFAAFGKLTDAEQLDKEYEFYFNA